MLKSDLIRPRLQLRGDTVQPRLLPASYRWLNVATELMALFRRHLGRSRGALDDALREYEGDSLDYPIIRGLAAVLANRATFDNQPPVEPALLREQLFGAGPATVRETGVGESGTTQLPLYRLPSREKLVRETAVSRNLTPKQIEHALFADLAEEQILQSVGDPLAPQALIDRYNLEVARGLLYWAREVQIRVADNYRDLFRYVKLMGLMYTIRPEPPGYHLTLHGPISPFVQSTIRYGLQFAKFMPALLLCDSWRMTAEVRPPNADTFLRYELDEGTTLRSHFKSSAEFASKLEANFAAEFEAKYTRADRVWELGYEDELILLDDTVMIPDFSFTHRKDGRRALLEIVGFWHPQYLRRKLAKIREAGRSDLIVLVYESVNVAAAAFAEAAAGEVLTFKRKPVLKDVLAAVERSAV